MNKIIREKGCRTIVCEVNSHRIAINLASETEPIEEIPLIGIKT